MRLKVSCDLKFNLEFPTPFIGMLRPQSGGYQEILKESYFSVPAVPFRQFTDSFGNLCQRFTTTAGFFELHSSAIAEIPEALDVNYEAGFVEIELLPDSVLPYLLPSRYCETDRFSQMAVSITNFSAHGYQQVKAIENWIRINIAYLPGSSDFPISAVEVNQRQSGVCRDLAHLGITLCRALSIPARIVVGYLLDLQPMDMHAWFEAFIGGRWYTFDPTQKDKKGGYVVVGYGRDAADVALYNQFGPAVYANEQLLSVEKLP